MHQHYAQRLRKLRLRVWFDGLKRRCLTDKRTAAQASKDSLMRRVARIRREQIHLKNKARWQTPAAGPPPSPSRPPTATPPRRSTSHAHTRTHTRTHTRAGQGDRESAGKSCCCGRCRRCRRRRSRSRRPRRFRRFRRR